MYHPAGRTGVGVAVGWLWVGGVDVGGAAPVVVDGAGVGVCRWRLATATVTMRTTSRNATPAETRTGGDAIRRLAMPDDRAVCASPTGEEGDSSTASGPD